MADGSKNKKRAGRVLAHEVCIVNAVPNYSNMPAWLIHVSIVHCKT